MFTIQVCPRHKYAQPESGHLLKDGSVGAGILMVFETQDKARKMGRYLTPLYNVYIEKCCGVDGEDVEIVEEM